MFRHLVVVLYCITTSVSITQTWNCDAEAACISEMFTCSSGNTCDLLCSGKYSCHFGALVCEPNSICSIECNSNSFEDYSCSDMIFDAINANSLDIAINGDNFQRSIVYCPINKNNAVCNVHFNYQTNKANFNNSVFYVASGFSSDLLFIGDATNWDSDIAAATVNVYYGELYKDICLIEKNITHNKLFCDRITTPAPTNPPILALTTEWTCHGRAECMSESFTCNPYETCSLVCYGQFACHFATLECGTNSVCYLECGSNGLDNSCSDMIVDARYAKTFVILNNIGSTSSFLDFARSIVYCPVNNYYASCKVYFATGFDEFDFVNTKFYAVNGLDEDIVFIGQLPVLPDHQITDFNFSSTYIHSGNNYDNICKLSPYTYLSNDSSSEYEVDLECISIFTPTPTKLPTAPTTPRPTYNINYFRKYPDFCRGYHFLKDDVSASQVINCNTSGITNIDTFNEDISQCQYNEIQFGSAYSSYSSYVNSDSTSIGAKFALSNLGGGGSLSTTRTNTKVTVSNSQSYIYRLDFQCIEADMTLPSYFKVVWDDDFLLDLNGLPQLFDTDDLKVNSDSYETFVNFFGKYGTHIIQSAKLGGRIYGTVITDYCSVSKDFSSSNAYDLCLNAEFKAIEGEVCDGTSFNVETQSKSTSYYISKMNVNVRGGDSTTFGSIINDFGNTDKQMQYSMWIDSLKDSAYVVGGNLQEIYSVIKDVVNSGNDHNMKKYTDDYTLLNIASAMQNAYGVYVTESINDDLHIGCQFDCGKGILDENLCQCQKCDSYQCCDDESDHAMFHSVIFALFYTLCFMLIRVIN